MQNDSLSERYGRPRRPFTDGAPEAGARGGLSKTARRWIIGVLVVATLVTAVFTVYRARMTVTPKDVSFAFPEDGRATVDFAVTKHPSATAECAVQVLSEKYAIVGWKTVTIGPNAVDDPGVSADGRTTNHRVTLRTVSEGVNGGVHSCWIVR